MREKLPELRMDIEHKLCEKNPDPDAESVSVPLWNRLLRDTEFSEKAAEVEDLRQRHKESCRFADGLAELTEWVLGAMIHERCCKSEEPPALNERRLNKYRKAWLLNELNMSKETSEHLAAHKAVEMGWSKKKLRPLPSDFWQEQFEKGCLPKIVEPWWAMSIRMKSPAFRTMRSQARKDYGTTGERHRRTARFRTMRSQARKDYQEWEKYYQTRREAYKGKFGHEPWDALFEMHVLDGKTDKEFLRVMGQLYAWSTKQDAAQEDDTQAAQ